MQNSQSAQFLLCQAPFPFFGKMYYIMMIFGECEIKKWVLFFLKYIYNYFMGGCVIENKI